MVESDYSETEEEGMDKLQLSSDSVDITLRKKRPRVEDSGDETDLLTKRHQSSFIEQSKILKNDAETISDKNDTDVYNIKEEEYILCPEKEQNVQEIFDISNLNMGKENKEKQDGKLKHKNGNENKNPEEVNIKQIIVENKHSSCEKSAINTSVISTSDDNQVGTEDNEVFKEEIDKMLDRKEDGLKEQVHTNQETKKRTVDTEVVDGLELSVECASDKEGSSSESEKEKDAKPRPKTIIVKAKPNESELDCSSEGEKSDLQQVTNILEIESQKNRVKRRGSRKSKLKASGSEDSQNSNSDEDYNPWTKKKMKKSLTAKKSNKHHSIESKRGRGKSIKRNSLRKNVNNHVSDKEDVYATVTEKTDETKTGMEEELSEKEFSNKSSSDNNSEKEENSTKGRRRRHSTTKSQDKHIQALKKYLSIAGVKIKSYNDIWADCKSNAAKIKRLKELLEENGVSGRPSLEKCKRVRKKKEKLKEVSELDTSNIISEGRITRARRNMENLKKTSPNTSSRYREARNTFKRIQTVVDIDSDSE